MELDVYRDLHAQQTTHRDKHGRENCKCAYGGDWGQLRTMRILQGSSRVTCTQDPRREMPVGKERGGGSDTVVTLLVFASSSHDRLFPTRKTLHWTHPYRFHDSHLTSFSHSCRRSPEATIQSFIASRSHKSNPSKWSDKISNKPNNSSSRNSKTQ